MIRIDNTSGYLDGQFVRITECTTDMELNNRVFMIADATVDYAYLKDSDGIDYITTAAVVIDGYIERVAKVWGGLEHVEGETVGILADCGYYGTAVVVNGEVTLDDYYNSVHIGLLYTGKVQPMRPEINYANTAQGRNKRITAATVRFFESLDCKIGPNWETYEEFIFRDADDDLEAATPLFTGDKRLLFSGGYTSDGYICIQSDKPLPLTVVAVISEMEIYD